MPTDAAMADITCILPNGQVVTLSGRTLNMLNLKPSSGTMLDPPRKLICT